MTKSSMGPRGKADAQAFSGAIAAKLKAGRYLQSRFGSCASHAGRPLSVDSLYPRQQNSPPDKGERMGSTGSGRISDYPGSSSKGGSGAGAGGGGGGGPPEDRCARAFHARLEDIEQSDYYRAHGSLPPLGTQLSVAHRKRLVAQTSNGESIGNLPTSLNYLASCLKDGWNYVGTVQAAASDPPVATVSADFAATPPG